MTREEAIAYGKRVIDLGLNDETQAFCTLAISALEKNESAEEWYKLLCEKWDSAENKGEDRPQGHWIEKGYVGDGNYLFECSECHSTDTQSKAVKVNYCWHCGANMRGE